MRAVIAALLVSLATAGSAPAQPVAEAFISYGPEDAARRLVVRGTTDIELFQPVMLAFLAGETDLRIDYEQWGSNDLYLITETDCRAGEPGADLVISSSVDQQVKLANDGCAIQHRSEESSALADVSNWRDEVFGITREPAVIVYNRATIGEDGPPQSRFDLIDLLRPENSPLRGRLATYDIEASGLGYLFAFADAQQATTYGSLIEAMGRAEAVAKCCSSTIIDGVASGEYLVAYNVLGSYALDRASKNSDLVVVAPSDYTLVLARAALIPKTARNPQTAGALIDYLLSGAGQDQLRQANLIVDTDSALADAHQLPKAPEGVYRPIVLSPALLVGLDRHKRAEFIERWRSSFPGRGPR